MRTPYIVAILQTVTSYSGQGYELEIYGRGYESSEDARRGAESSVTYWSGIPYGNGPGTTATRPHRAVFRMGCDVCNVTGVKPGCKRKACESCKGLGTHTYADASYEKKIDSI